MLAAAGEAPAEPVQPRPTLRSADAPTAPVSASAASVVDEQGEGWLAHNGLRLNLPMRIVHVDGEEATLTRSEFDLLAALLQSGRRVRTKADLALLLRGESYVTSHFVSEADKRGIEVHMGNLRKKIGESSTQPRWIETVRGVGYRLTAAED
jgi:DNA-binding response OmpR family regulator